MVLSSLYLSDKPCPSFFSVFSDPQQAGNLGPRNGVIVFEGEGGCYSYCLMCISDDPDARCLGRHCVFLPQDQGFPIGGGWL